MLQDYQRQWGVEQWAEFLTAQDIPCMPRSKTILLALEELQGEELSAADLTALITGDPFLCLRLLREAEKRRSQRLGHETTTPLGAVMQVGLAAFRRLVLESPETTADNLGLAAVEGRAVMASQIAQMWGRARADVAPDEVAMAALLAEIGEMLLWNFAPELPRSSQAALARGAAAECAQAQELACGFRFRELSLRCAELWNLPRLLIQLIRGVDNVRANLCQLYLDTARHLARAPDDPALREDLALAHQLIPRASLPWLAAHMIGLDEEQQASLVAATEQLLAERTSPCLSAPA